MPVDASDSKRHIFNVPSELAYPHIVKLADEPARLENHPRTRVSMIVTDYQGRGWSAEEIVRQYPYLTLAEIHAALAYYHDHQAEIDHELTAEMQENQNSRRTAPETATLKRLRALKSQRGS